MKADPPCFDMFNRYVVCGNGTVTDTLTGLIWLQKANCFDPKTYKQANEAAANLQDGDCGLSDNSSPGDWRLATKAEWEEMIASAVELNCTYANYPALTDKAGMGCYKDETSHAFSDVLTLVYWSSTSNVDNPRAAWYVHLYYGHVASTDKSIGYYVWPVRGGK